MVNFMLFLFYHGNISLHFQESGSQNCRYDYRLIPVSFFPHAFFVHLHSGISLALPLHTDKVHNFIFSLITLSHHRTSNPVTLPVFLSLYALFSPKPSQIPRSFTVPHLCMYLYLPFLSPDATTKSQLWLNSLLHIIQHLNTVRGKTQNHTDCSQFVILYYQPQMGPLMLL